MMRFAIPAAAALALLAFQAQAQTSTQGTAPEPGSNMPATTATPQQAAPSMKKGTAHRQTLQQRYEAANTTHDGKLTKDQAAAANWPYVVNNFAAIDKDKKGYVTVEDIRAYARARHAAQRKSPAVAPPENRG